MNDIVNTIHFLEFIDRFTLKDFLNINSFIDLSSVLERLGNRRSLNLVAIHNFFIIFIKFIWLF